MSKLPQRPLTDIDLTRCTRNIKHFRGVFMRDKLPKKPRRNESGIVNLDISKGPGTHWVAYKKYGDKVQYFDSFGNLQPPLELIRYFCGSEIKYNYTQYQNYNTWNCGHLCIKFLNE